MFVTIWRVLTGVAVDSDIQDDMAQVTVYNPIDTRNLFSSVWEGVFFE